MGSVADEKFRDLDRSVSGSYLFVWLFIITVLAVPCSPISNTACTNTIFIFHRHTLKPPKKVITFYNEKYFSCFKRDKITLRCLAIVSSRNEVLVLSTFGTRMEA